MCVGDVIFDNIGVIFDNKASWRQSLPSMTRSFLFFHCFSGSPSPSDVKLPHHPPGVKILGTWFIMHLLEIFEAFASESARPSTLGHARFCDFLG